MARKNRTSQFKLINNFFGENKKILLSLGVFLAVILFVALWLHNYFLTSPIFDCAKIEIMKPGKEGGLEPKREHFELNYPVNIFEADPITLSNKIKAAHPEFQIVVITKFLPNRIVATIKDRYPVARIKIGKTLIVDYEGMVLSEPANLDIESLPLITGLESQLYDPRTGTKVKSRRLGKALNILALISSKSGFKNSVVEVVDLSYPEKANFKMDGMTVILGDNEYDKKLDELALTLSNSKIDKSRVDSVDLRFTDPAVTFRSEKK